MYIRITPTRVLVPALNDVYLDDGSAICVVDPIQELVETLKESPIFGRLDRERQERVFWRTLAIATKELRDE